MNQEFNKKSYAAHENHLRDKSEQTENSLSRLEITGNIDYIYHQMKYELLTPFLSVQGKWLTVGDGIGTDANWLFQNKQDVLATDLTDAILKKAKEKGFIESFQIENVEHLSFDNDSFDFVLCKQAFHHFPRPYAGLYEMLRVAKKAVILIEPHDPLIKMPALLFINNILDKINAGLINKFWKNQHSFETVGNYVYKLSQREIEKVAMGMNLPATSFVGINDYYTESPEFKKVPPNKRFLKKFKRKIKFKNILSQFGIIPYGKLGCVIFKTEPSQKIIDAMKKKGYKYISLPENPYINK